MTAPLEPRSVLIIGATGGIGQALLAATRSRWPKASIVAAARRPPAPGSSDAADASVRWCTLDLLEPAHATALADALAEDQTPDLVFVATGFLHNERFAPEKSLRQLSADAFAYSFSINASGPLLVLQALDRVLTRRAPDPQQRCRVMVLSAKVGSISDNGLGGWYAYRMAKAALNMGVRNLGHEYTRNARKPVVVAVHPGTTFSPLSDPFAKKGLATVDAATTADRLIALAERLDDSHQGGFFHWDGSRLPD
ncbi:MAG: SDR family NAD(P)-dependent oxidoreductase [Pseudomonadota bacterium]